MIFSFLFLYLVYEEREVQEIDNRQKQGSRKTWNSKRHFPVWELSVSILWRIGCQIIGWHWQRIKEDTRTAQIFGKSITPTCRSDRCNDH